MIEAPGQAFTLARPLCVACRKCAHKSAFLSMSPEARAPEAETLKRLKCSRCGARRFTATRLSDDREAARWLADR